MAAAALTSQAIDERNAMHATVSLKSRPFTRAHLRDPLDFNRTLCGRRVLGARRYIDLTRGGEPGKPMCRSCERIVGEVV